MGCGNIKRKENEPPHPEKDDSVEHSKHNLDQQKAKEIKEENEFIDQSEKLDQEVAFEEIEDKSEEDDNLSRDLQIEPQNENTIKKKEILFLKNIGEKTQSVNLTPIKLQKAKISREKIEEKDPLNTLEAEIQSIYATPADLAIFEYMNIVRQHPENIVQKMQKAIVSKELARNYSEEALKEAIHDLSVKRGVEPVAWDDDTFKACNLHVQDLGNTGKISHKGSDGKTIMDRLNRFGKYHGICGEVIQSGKRDAEEIVLDLIIDINNEKKQNRRTLMDPKFKRGGVASGSHKKFGVCTVFGLIGQSVKA